MSGWSGPLPRAPVGPGYRAGCSIFPLEASPPWWQGLSRSLRPPGPGWVVGEFVSYGDEGELDAALADLDQVQDVEGDLFIRHVLPVRLESGLRYTAWVYLFEADRLLKLEREAVELPGGDWTTYLEAADE